jgi:hypothetical protein
MMVFMFLFFLPQIEKYVKTNAPQLYLRIFLKTEMFLSGTNSKSGDSVRLNNMHEMSTNFQNYIIPKGFVSRQTVKDKTGRFIDFPLSELFYMFGLFAILLLLGIGICTFGCFYHYFNKGSDSVIFVVISLIMLMLLFLEGTFLSSSYVAPFTGYCLGRIKFYSKITFFKGSKLKTSNLVVYDKV